MFEIDNGFVGGNIQVVGRIKGKVFLKNEIRDTKDDWFYWAFRVRGAEGQTVTFQFTEYDRVGYFGPAVSSDLVNWRWLYSPDSGYNCLTEAFTYTFGEDEHEVYFAHHMLYHPARFLDFVAKNGIESFEFAKSRKGRSVPALKLGSGKTQILLTSRHHACESTGNYVLEGVLEELIREPIEDTTILCVPFVDYDGVIDGDQGKNRIPYDHNRDYNPDLAPIYPETSEIRSYVNKHGCNYCFDFHSPWHQYEGNDLAHRVDNQSKKPEFAVFGKLLDDEITKESFYYTSKDDLYYGESWNSISAHIAAYMHTLPECVESFALEMPYIGLPNNVVSQENMVELGRCYGRAIRKFIEKTR